MRVIGSASFLSAMFFVCFLTSDCGVLVGLGPWGPWAHALERAVCKIYPLYSPIVGNHMKNATLQTTPCECQRDCFTNCAETCLAFPSLATHCPTCPSRWSSGRPPLVLGHHGNGALTWPGRPPSYPIPLSDIDPSLFLGCHGAPSDGSSGDTRGPGRGGCSARGDTACSGPTLLPATGPAAMLHR